MTPRVGGTLRPFPSSGSRRSPRPVAPLGRRMRGPTPVSPITGRGRRCGVGPLARHGRRPSSSLLACDGVAQLTLVHGRVALDAGLSGAVDKLGLRVAVDVDSAV